jgi:anthranilate synthase/aminodeoxychorismate synthase-like glutamine amidotransferase
MILVLDNHDSFVYNLARYCELAGWNTTVIRSDAITTNEIKSMNPKAIVISPGPCTPTEAGICVETIQKLGASIPILGVCLGHQCIGAAYGASIIRAEPVHGRASTMNHTGNDLFTGLPPAFEAGRYHSLAIDPQHTAPLETLATTSDGIIMSVKHKLFPVYGVQFHPESILTPHGMDIIRNFSNIVRTWHSDQKMAA